MLSSMVVPAAVTEFCLMTDSNVGFETRLKLGAYTPIFHNFLLEI